MAQRPSTRSNAIKRSLKAIKLKDIKYIAVKNYSRGMEKLKRKAVSNAPKGKTGKLSRSIDKKIMRGRSRKTLLKGAVFANVIYDKVQHEGIPNSALGAKGAKRRSRTWRGKKHKLRAGQNYSTTTKRKDGKTRSGSRNWAFGKRRIDRYMTKGQQFKKVNNEIARGIGLDIVNKMVSNLKAYT